MDERAYERTPLNPAAQLLTQAQTDIKIEIKKRRACGRAVFRDANGNTENHR